MKKSHKYKEGDIVRPKFFMRRYFPEGDGVIVECHDEGAQWYDVAPLSGFDAVIQTNTVQLNDEEIECKVGEYTG